MSGWKFMRRGAVMATLLALLSPAGTGAAELDPVAVVFKLPDQINWKESATAGNEWRSTGNTNRREPPIACRRRAN
jgi:hypothetical protein